MKLKTVVVCSGGPVTEITDLTKFNKDETVFIGADRGALHLLQNGIVPKEAVGDFDSVTETEYEIISNSIDIVGRFRSEKDETDTELAVSRALSYNPERIVLTGVTGGRLDHTESSLHLIYRLQIKFEKISFSILNKSNELSMLIPGNYQLISDKQFPYISFFPFGGPVTGLNLTGFKYETVNATMDTGMTKFTSNELASSSCTISFHSGICLMVRSSDA